MGAWLQCVLKGGQEVDVSISNGAGPAAATLMNIKVSTLVNDDKPLYDTCGL